MVKDSEADSGLALNINLKEVKKTKKIKMAIAFALILTLTFAAFMISIPAIAAKSKVILYLTLSLDRNPDPIIGVGQPLKLEIATSPGITPYGEIWPDAYAIFTKPDGTTDTMKGPFMVPGMYSLNIIFEYVPNMAGEWTVEFNYPGDENYDPATAKRSFTVQQEPVDLFIETTGFISVSPKIAGIGQQVLINGWVIPQPVMTGDLHYGIYVYITAPDGVTDTFGPLTSWESGTVFLTYTPNKLGKYTAKLSWAGDGTYYTACESPPFEFTVQEEAVELWPAAELPTDYWERPITAEYREWYVLGGAWPNTGRLECDTRGACYNPYSTAPNTAHILWTYDAGIGGLIGGEAGSMRFTPSNSRVIMGGRVYFADSLGLHCLDVHSGEELWVQPGIRGTLYAQWGSTPYIWVLSSGFKLTRYDATTGQLSTTVDVDVPSSGPWETHARSGIDENRYIYFQTYDENCRSIRVMKWDTNVNSRNWTDHLVWTVEKEDYWYCDGGLSVHDGYVWLNPNGANTTVSIDATTGEVLWSITRPYWMQGAGTIEGGYGFGPDGSTRCVHAFDLETGVEVWTSEPAEYPWGCFWAYQMGAAYGNIYVENYDGHLYCFDVETGETVWKYYSGDTYETPYDAWAFYNNPAIADGKIYAGTSEHSPTDPYPRGNRLYALNAYDGTLLWSIAGAWNQKAIADGVLTAFNEYDGRVYAFGKGKTETTVSVQDDVVTKGDSVLIKGTVTDQSPGDTCLGISAAGTPAIADEDMSEWMEYLYMQRQFPADATGVEVVISTIDPNGNNYELGRATTETSGTFGCAVDPPVPGLYKIIATFEGSESYYGSSAVTYIIVEESQSAGQQLEPELVEPTQTAEAPFITTDVVVILAVVIVAVIALVGFFVFRKQR